MSYNNFYESTGYYFKKWRNENDLTLREVSERSGKSIGWLNDIESGRNRIYLEDAILICGIYGKTINELYNAVMKTQKNTKSNSNKNER